jgi:hypothetical protein
MSMEEMLEKIDRVLSRWSATREAHGLSDELIEEGKKVIAEEKGKK